MQCSLSHDAVWSGVFFFWLTQRTPSYGPRRTATRPCTTPPARATSESFEP